MASGSQSLSSSSTNPAKSACSLPPEKVFPIQMGCELFRLSGASIASDGQSIRSDMPRFDANTDRPAAPSYFSQFFEDQLRQGGDAANLRTLYIDRDPHTFQDIARHLQGTSPESLDL